MFQPCFGYRCWVIGFALLCTWSTCWALDKDHAFPKDLISEADFLKLYAESTKQMQDYARSQSSLNQDYKKLENEAYHFMLLCEVQRKTGNEDAIRKATLAQNAAKVIAAAASKKDHATIKQQLADISDWRRIKADKEVKSDMKSISDEVPMDNLMKGLVQPLFDKFDKTPKAYRNLNAANFNSKLPEIQLASYKLAIYSWATHYYVPKKDDMPNGKKPEDWDKWTDEMMKASQDLINAAKAKKQNDLKSAVRKLDTSCTKCHDDFRMKNE